MQKCFLQKKRGEVWAGADNPLSIEKKQYRFLVQSLNSVTAKNNKNHHDVQFASKDT